MKVAAHPMLVAVALGLLGPVALAVESSDEEGEPCIDCDAKADALESSSLDAVVDALEDEDAPYWARLTLVDVGAGADEAASWTDTER